MMKNQKLALSEAEGSAEESVESNPLTTKITKIY
jgi:hypothetical protein